MERPSEKSGGFFTSGMNFVFDNEYIKSHIVEDKKQDQEQKKNILQRIKERDARNKEERIEQIKRVTERHKEHISREARNTRHNISEKTEALLRQKQMQAPTPPPQEIQKAPEQGMER